jgi:hypothetical protein
MIPKTNEERTSSFFFMIVPKSSPKQKNRVFGAVSRYLSPLSEGPWTLIRCINDQMRCFESGMTPIWEQNVHAVPFVLSLFTIPISYFYLGGSILAPACLRNKQYHPLFSRHPMVHSTFSFDCVISAISFPVFC